MIAYRDQGMLLGNGRGSEKLEVNHLSSLV